MMIRTVILSICALLFAMVANGSAPGSFLQRAEAGGALTGLGTSPLSSIETAGSDIEISILIDNVTDLGSYHLELAYDPNVLQFESWEDGGILARTGRTHACQDPSVLSPGIVELACSSLDRNGPLGPSGSGSIGELTFSTSCSGQSMITFRDTSLYDTSGFEIPHSQAPGSFVLLTPGVGSEPCLGGTPPSPIPDDSSPTPTSSPPPTPLPTRSNGCGDANGDETVNAVDAALVLFKIAGLLPDVPRPNNADVDGNGRLDSIDVLKILQVSAGLVNQSALQCA